MIFTENETTTAIGYCKATCLAKTINNRAQIVTWELLYPRYIHSELLTHYEWVSLRNYMTYLRDDEKLNMKQIFERVEEWANL